MKFLKTVPAIISAVLLAACSDDPVLPENEPAFRPQPGDELLYHDDARTDVYPKLNNEIYLNPPPMMVPAEWRGDSLMEFELSQSPSFDGNSLFRSEPRPWSMANPHQRLDPGCYYWRYRCTAADGSCAGTWSAPIPFIIEGGEDVFVTPTIQRFNEALRSGHPRLVSYLDAGLEAARASVKTHPEYKSLIQRAASALNLETATIERYYQTKAATEELNNNVNYLYQAYYLTLDEVYAEKLLDIIRALIMRPATDDELFKADSNFQPTNIAQCYARIYDLLFERLSRGERNAAEQFMHRIVQRLAKIHVGKRESVLFETHFWQHNMMVLFQCAYMLHDKEPYRELAVEVLDYCYEMWVTRAPGTGYNRDGVWHNSSAYFNTNVETLHYMPLILGNITGADFLAHPWYKAAGRALLYTWPAASASCGFGDGSTDADKPGRIRIAFADFLARHTGDEYAGWYAAKNESSLRTDFLLRLERMVNAYAYSSAKPDRLERLLWYKDCGEVVMHSDLAEGESNLSLSFRSSRYGNTNHMYANQNAFNLLYKGEPVFYNTGYYTKYGTPHHLTDSRHSRAHNTILVNGIGQSFTTEAWGHVRRAASTDRIAYSLGDASYAYADTSHMEAWVRNIAAAGLKQTPEYGFGKTPLTKYLRHCVMLGNDIALIYDEVEASEPAEFRWMLNSPSAITLDRSTGYIGKDHSGKGFMADARLFSSDALEMSVTDQFINSPGNPSVYPDQWHFSANTPKVAATRFIFVARIRPSGAEPAAIAMNGNCLEIDGWQVEAEMDSSRPAALRITDADGSSLIYESGTGMTTLSGTDSGHHVEIIASDYLPKHSRTI